MRPIHAIVIHHTASRAAAHSWEDIRAWHLAKQPPWLDIGYHYGCVFDNSVWQWKTGRPVEQVGAHAKGRNFDTIGVAVEGNYELGRLPWEAFDLLVAEVGKLCDQFSLYPESVVGHREVIVNGKPYPTLCPGRWFPMNALRGALADRRFANRQHDT